MTLVIGIQCNDGVVLAAEGKAAPAADGIRISENVQKIFAIDDRFLLGVGGFSGQAQRYRAALTKIKAVDDALESRDQMIEHIQERTIRVFKTVKTAALKAKKHLGVACLGDILAEGLVAFVCADGAALAHITVFGTCDGLAETTYHVIGDGNRVAMPFLSYVKRHVWKNQPPAVATAVLSALWTLRFAHNAAGEYGPPWTIATLQSNGKGAMIDMLPDDALDPHHEMIDTLEHDFERLPEQFSPERATEVATLPEMDNP